MIRLRIDKGANVYAGPTGRERLLVNLPKGTTVTSDRHTVLRLTPTRRQTWYHLIEPDGWINPNAYTQLSLTKSE